MQVSLLQKQTLMLMLNISVIVEILTVQYGRVTILSMKDINLVLLILTKLII